MAGGATCSAGGDWFGHEGLGFLTIDEHARWLVKSCQDHVTSSGPRCSVPRLARLPR